MGLDRYELLSPLGQGGMAETWRAVLRGSAGVRKPVVLKKVLPHLTANRDFVAAFVDEGRIAAKLSHGNVVQVIDFGESDAEYFLALEWVDGRSLAELMKASIRPLSIELVLYVVREVLEGLRYVHSAADESGRPLHVVHRDVTPENVLLSWDGDVKIADFGIARAALAGRSETQPGMVKGKLAYMSPEQMQGKRVDAQTDVYAVGVMMYRLLCGQLPFDGTPFTVLEAKRDERYPPPRTHKPELPVELERCITLALAADPGRRTASAEDFLQRIGAELATHYPSASRATVRSALAETFRDHEGQHRLATQSELPELPAPGAETARTVSLRKRPPTRSRAIFWVAPALLVALGAAGGYIGLRASSRVVEPTTARRRMAPSAHPLDDLRKLAALRLDTVAALGGDDAAKVDALRRQLELGARPARVLLEAAHLAPLGHPVNIIAVDPMPESTFERAVAARGRPLGSQGEEMLAYAYRDERGPIVAARIRRVEGDPRELDATLLVGDDGWMIGNIEDWREPIAFTAVDVPLTFILLTRDPGRFAWLGELELPAVAAERAGSMSLPVELEGGGDAEINVGLGVQLPWQPNTPCHCQPGSRTVFGKRIDRTATRSGLAEVNGLAPGHYGAWATAPHYIPGGVDFDMLPGGDVQLAPVRLQKGESAFLNWTSIPKQGTPERMVRGDLVHRDMELKLDPNAPAGHVDVVVREADGALWFEPVKATIADEGPAEMPFDGKVKGVIVTGRERVRLVTEHLYRVDSAAGYIGFIRVEP